MNHKYLFQCDADIVPTRLWVRDPINGHRILQENSRDKLFNWCAENCTGDYWVGMGYMDFELEEDFVLAVLTYGSGR